jgi:hypothetical protein
VPRSACAAAEHRKRANRRRRRSAVQLCPTGVLHSRQGRVCAVPNDRCCEGGRGCGQ